MALRRGRTWNCVGLVLAGLLLPAVPNAAAQVVITPPVISGQARIGQDLMATAGSWEPNMGEIADYQWLRCPPAGPCVAIGGATGLMYTVAAADAGHSLQIRLTVAGDFADSAATEIVPLQPSNTLAPSVAGDAREGLVLTASPGTWNGVPPPSFGYQWQRCDQAGADCQSIAGATGAAYMPAATDVGLTVRVVVTASNLGGNASAASQPTARVRRAPLVNVEPPAITGVAEVERSVAATTGQWRTSGPIDFLYRWLRCNASGSRCDPLAGATSPTYQVRMSDIGFALRVRVTAINDAGSLTSESAVSALVPEPPGVQTFTQSGTSVFAPSAALIQPFPRVRIKGYVTSRGAVLQLVTVRGPARARIALGCRGRSCPFRRRARRIRTPARIRSLERPYRAGTRLTFRITKRALIGKYTRIIIRAGREPWRRDRCLLPGDTRPVVCPTGG